MEAASAPVGRFIIGSHVLPTSHFRSESREHNDLKYCKITAGSSVSLKPSTSVGYRLKVFLNKRRCDNIIDLSWKSGGRRMRTAAPLIIAEYQRESAPLTGEVAQYFLQKPISEKVEAERELVEQKEKSLELEQTVNELGEKTEILDETLSATVDNSKDVIEDLQAQPEKAYAEHAEWAMDESKDITEELRGRTEKAGAVLTDTELEPAEKAKDFDVVTDTVPEPVMGIEGTTSHADSAAASRKGAKIHDFCLGIPYGGFLVGGGIISFLLTGSKAAIQFGVILGGLILFSSVKSLKVWKKGESSIPLIKAQAAIAFVLVAREVRRFLETKAFFPSVPMAFISGAMLGFYGYIFFSGGNPPKKSKVGLSEQGA